MVKFVMFNENQSELLFKLNGLKRDINQIRIAINSGADNDYLTNKQIELDYKRSQYNILLNKLNAVRNYSKTKKLKHIEKANNQASSKSKILNHNSALQFIFNDKYIQIYKLQNNYFSQTAIIDTIIS